MNAGALCQWGTSGDVSPTLLLAYINTSQTCQGSLPLSILLLTERELKMMKTVMSILFVNSWYIKMKEIRGAIKESSILKPLI